MIKEAYVSYEVAKLLKEKGFGQETSTRYAIGKITESWYDDYRERVLNFKWEEGYFIGIEDIKHDFYGETISAPTHQMAMAWLREEKNLYIEIRRNLNTFYFKWCIQEGAVDRALSEYKYESYEEAVEAALLWVLQNLV